jgi:hypothetical protein
MTELERELVDALEALVTLLRTIREERISDPQIDTAIDIAQTALVRAFER